MERNETPQGKKPHRKFGARFAKQIVKEIEEGLPRKEAMRMHGMSYKSLDVWMSQYGSPEYQAGKRRTYSPTQKRSILRAVESGMTLKEVQIAHGLKSTSLIRGWLREIKKENVDISSHNPPSMKQKAPQVPQSDEVRALQKALAEAELKNKALETLIDVAEETLKINIRKKPGARQSSK